MPTPTYKPTLFDRHGPAAGDMVRAFAYGMMVFGVTVGVLFALTGFHWWTLPVGVVAGAIVALFAWLLGEVTGATVKRIAVDGTSTPYKEQYSYQQALVMQGRVDDALESFEAVIAEQPNEVSPRMKAAELYVRERQNHRRAAELFREIQRIPNLTAGDDIYASNRLVDLYNGPLGEPGRALVELRRLADRYPGSAAAKHALDALATLKVKHLEDAR